MQDAEAFVNGLGLKDEERRRVALDLMGQDWFVVQLTEQFRRAVLTSPLISTTQLEQLSRLVADKPELYDELFHILVNGSVYHVHVVYIKAGEPQLDPRIVTHHCPTMLLSRYMMVLDLLDVFAALGRYIHSPFDPFLGSRDRRYPRW